MCLNYSQGVCDLHTHSIYSDGTLSPEQLVIKAKEVGVRALALTDHNTVDGIQPFLTAGKNFGVETVAGVEITCDYNGKELHVVALFIQDCLMDMQKFLEIPKIRKEENNKLLADNLIKNGYDVDYAKIKAQTVGSINRVHFANELIKKGYIKSVKEGFDTILSEKAGLYVPAPRLTAFEVIDFIKSKNAVAVLAHPMLDLTEQELFEFLPQAKEHGLDAIEVRYSRYSESTQEFCEKTAKRFGVLMSGGSDFHGENKPDIMLGAGEGNLKVPYEFLEQLRARKTSKI